MIAILPDNMEPKKGKGQWLQQENDTIMAKTVMLLIVKFGNNLPRWVAAELVYRSVIQKAFGSPGNDLSYAIVQFTLEILQHVASMSWSQHVLPMVLAYQRTVMWKSVTVPENWILPEATVNKWKSRVFTSDNGGNANSNGNGNGNGKRTATSSNSGDGQRNCTAFNSECGCIYQGCMQKKMT